MSMIYSDECLELGLPLPLTGEKQIDYVKRLLASGRSINTRIARYIGIGNLHSIVSTMQKQRFPYAIKHSAVFCPKTKRVPPQLVDVVWMNEEQLKEYWEMKGAKENAPN
ncbi:hypothetical protein [Shewanella subflava]|uniref:Helix-turn-helix domain-containing protein n=1 Tax=Shewanella subflava TaxID=2986476 RepID=A0ABT3IA39_9GAMM|nr:hypothetical protein [Shewanella subflava]MCW3172820.1 hypothetical protein [Shewanella subflava]